MCRRAFSKEREYKKLILSIAEILTEAQVTDGLTAENLAPWSIKHLTVRSYILFIKYVHVHPLV
jgi:hypothetical protein